MKTGTCHFPSFDAAVTYYAGYYHYGELKEAVRRKIEDKEIIIGPPSLRPGQRAYIDKEENRYFIEE